MASNPQLVQFLMLLNELNDTEFIRFLTDVTAKCGRDSICTALFTYFSDANQVSSSKQILDTMMSITENIMRGRSKNDISKQNSDTPSSLQSLSTPLIGEIASYLELSEYISFGRCHRATYLGCTSPCTLRSLDLTQVVDYHSVDLNAFPQIRHLAFDLSKCYDLGFPIDRDIFNHLQKLELYHNDVHESDIGHFLNQTALSLSTITHLKLSTFAGGERFCFPMESLSSFPNTESLSMHGVYFNLDDSSIPRIKGCLPKMTTFKASGLDTNTLNQMVSIFGKQLKALEVDESNMDIPEHVCFEEMEEFSSLNAFVDRPIMDTIRRSTKLLKRIYFVWGESEESLVMELLSEQKRLEQLVIKTKFEDLQNVCGALDRAIFNIRKMGNKKMQITLTFYEINQRVNASDIIYNLSKVVNALQSSKIEEFLIHFNLCYRSLGTIENLESELADFKEQNSSRFDVHFKHVDIMVTSNGYSNKECIFFTTYRGWLTDF